MAYQCRTTDVSRVQIVEVCPKGRRGMPQARLCAARAAAGVGGKDTRVSQGQQKGAQSAGKKIKMRIIMMIIDVWPEYCSCDQAPPGGAPGGAVLPSAAMACCIIIPGCMGIAITGCAITGCAITIGCSIIGCGLPSIVPSLG